MDTIVELGVAMMAAELKANRVKSMAVVAAACVAGVLVAKVDGWLGWALAVVAAAGIGGVARWWQRR
ncbi:hypothetical protein [Streptomyces violascens]|uniref:hypothetical protein n=1 Tax=Streptomyces violascens TaxID=67381 RepID=UPI003654328B